MILGQRFENAGAVTSGVTDVTIMTNSGIAGTKSGWTQLTAATSFDAFGIDVQLIIGASGRSDLVDIGMGPVGSEQVLVPDVMLNNGETSSWLPFRGLFIPAGTRLAARFASTATSGAPGISVIIGPGGMADSPRDAFQRVTAYGKDATAANATGTTVDPGGTANTKGAWTQLSASCDEIRRLMLVLGTRKNTALTVTHWMFDIGVGPAGSEQVIVPNVESLVSPFTQLTKIAPFVFGPLELSIPAGARLAVRSQCGTNDTTDRLLDVMLYGVN